MPALSRVSWAAGWAVQPDEQAQCGRVRPQVGGKGRAEKRPSSRRVSGSSHPCAPHQDFLRSASPDVFRLFCLRSSYRSGELAVWPESNGSWGP